MKRSITKFAIVAAVATIGSLSMSPVAQAALTIDLRAASVTLANNGEASPTVINSTKSITVGSVGDTVFFDVYARITGPGTYGLQSVFGAFGIPNGTTKGVISPNGANETFSPNAQVMGIVPWNDTGSVPGKQQDLFGNGNTDLGALALGGASGTTNASSDYAGARALSIITSNWSTIDSNTVEEKIGSIKLSITAVGTSDTSVNFFPRTNASGGGLSGAATWKEDSNATRTPANSTFQGGTDVILSATAAPEPASLGVLALGGLALLARRRKTA